MIDLSNKTVVIIGAGRGIGQSIAKRIAKCNANVILCARSQNELESTQSLILSESPKSNVQIAKCDLTKDNDLKNLKNNHIPAAGLFGLIITSAVYGPIGNFETLNFDEWSEAIQINLIGVARAIHTLHPTLRPNSRIILFSGGGQGPIANFSAYTASKGGIWRLVETLGAEFSKNKIFLNAIAPGNVNTKFLDDLLSAGPSKSGEELYKKSLEQKQNGGNSPEKTCDLCEYLLSNNSVDLYGKIISSLWDPYFEFKELKKISESDLYSMRRVIDSNGNTRFSK